VALAPCLLASLACAQFASGGALARIWRDSGPASARAVVPGLTATREGRLRIFDEVWSLVRERYYDPHLRGLDWDALGEAARPRAAGAGGEAEFYVVLRGLLASLRDPHTRVFAPGQGADWRVKTVVSIGVSVREVGGETIVSEVERGTAAWRAGVRAGDLLASVDGEPAPTLVARRAAERPLSDARTARLLAVARLFDGPRDTMVAAVFRRGSRQLGVELRREPRVREPSFETREMGDGLRLVSFNIFTPEIAARLARELGPSKRRASALVIDLRDNGGGDAEAMTDAASIFLPAGTPLGAFTDRAGRVRLDPRTRAALLSTAHALPRFDRTVVLLIGPHTASAAEVFAAALGEQGRATVVGERSCGCVLGISRRHTLPDGGTLDISETDYRTARGARLEGAGVVPDYTVVPTREDLRASRDPALARAVELTRQARLRPDKKSATAEILAVAR
jgi:carboxyl-terminal processing protease